MKQLKKVGAIVLALCMCMALCVTAFAASSDDTGKFSITIENSMAGHTYTAYKIFDVTYDNSGNYSYTVTFDSAWYSLFTNENNATLTYDQVSYDMPFTFTATTGATDDGTIIYNVAVATKSDGSEYTDEEIIGYLNAAIGQFATYDKETETWTVTGITAAAESVNGTGSTVTISVTDPGYYFVTSTLGSIVSITTTDPNPTIVDKNPTISIEKVITHNDEVDAHDEHAEADGMGEDVSFDVTANVPIVEGDNYVLDYTITDSMTNGLLIELTEEQFYQGSDGKYYLSDDVINEWVTLYDGTGTALDSFTDSVYSYSFELIGYDTYTDETAGETVHTFSGFVLTYYTYDVDTYKTALAAALAAAGYSLDTVWPSDSEWPDASQIGDDFDFPSESYFTSSSYPTNASIEIAYTAHVSSLEGYENTNTIYLDHEVTPFSHPVPWQPTPGPQIFARDYIYSWELQILKIDSEDSTPLAGAIFTLESDSMKDVKVGHSYLYVPLSELTGETYTYGGETYQVSDFESTYYVTSTDSSGNTTYTHVSIDTVLDEEGNYKDGYSAETVYRRILTDEVTEGEDTEYSVVGTSDENGYLYFEGLGTGVFTLTEITAPDGYNLLTDPIVFEIGFYETGTDEEGYVGHFTVTYGTIDEDGNFVAETGDDGTELTDSYILVEEIKNNSGSILPGTGGMGVYVFYIVGGALVLAAAVVLITRRRVNRAV